MLVILSFLESIKSALNFLLFLNGIVHFAIIFDLKQKAHINKIMIINNSVYHINPFRSKVIKSIVYSERLFGIYSDYSVIRQILGLLIAEI